MKVIFFGSSIHSLKIIDALHSLPDISLAGLVSQPDRPVGRKQILTPTPVSKYAVKNDIPLLRPGALTDKPWELENAQELVNFIKKINPEMAVVAYYGQKIPNEVISIPKYGILNIHPSLLPEYPGSSPVAYAIMDGRKETGVTIIKMNEKFDAGEIVVQEKEEIKNTDVPEDLYERLFSRGAELLIKILPDYLKGKIKLKAQGKRTTAYAKRLTREDGKIDWNWPPERIERFIRAMTPWPGAWTLLRLPSSGQTMRLKILKAHLDNGKLVLDQVQLEGKNPVNWQQFQKGYPAAKFLS